MPGLSYTDTIGILLLVLLCGAAASYFSGILQTAAAIIGFGILGLLVINFFIQGYTDARPE